MKEITDPHAIEERLATIVTDGRTVQLQNQAYEEDDQRVQFGMSGELEAPTEDNVPQYYLRVADKYDGPCGVAFLPKHVHAIEELDSGNTRIVLR